MLASANKHLQHLANQLKIDKSATVFCIRWMKKTLGGIYLVSSWNSYCKPSLIEKPSWCATGSINLSEVGLELYNTESKQVTSHRVLIEPTDEIDMLLHEDQSSNSKNSLQYAVELRKNGNFLMGFDVFGEPYKLKRK